MLLMVAMAGAPAAANAQVVTGAGDSGVSVSVMLDQASSFIWRGIEETPDASIQPGIWLNYGPLEVGTWGSYSFNGEHGEQDFWVTYYLPELPFGQVAVTLNDYYERAWYGNPQRFFDFPGVSECPEGEEQYGKDLKCAMGRHTMEVAGLFSASFAPVEFVVAYNIHNDPENALYTEAAYRPELFGFDLGFALGGVLGESNWYYETEGTAITNVSGSIGRSVPLGRFSLPVVAEVMRAPHREQTFYALRIGLAAEW